MEEVDEGIITEEEEEVGEKIYDNNNNNFTIWDPNVVNTNAHLGRHEYFRRKNKRDEFTSAILDEFKYWILTSKTTNSPVLKTITKIKYFAQLKKVFDYFEVSHSLFINQKYK